VLERELAAHLVLARRALWRGLAVHNRVLVQRVAERAEALDDLRAAGAHGVARGAAVRSRRASAGGVLRRLLRRLLPRLLRGLLLLKPVGVLACLRGLRELLRRQARAARAALPCAY
jgi:hypothetical protein